MAENYKLLYEQMKKIVTTYQDEVVPGLREIIKDLEQNQIKVRCKDCKHLVLTEEGEHNPNDCVCDYWDTDGLTDDDFCSRGEMRTNEPEKSV